MQRFIGNTACDAEAMAIKLNRWLREHKGWKIEDVHITPYGDRGVNMLALVSDEKQQPDEN